jgi:hypothetical protein
MRALFILALAFGQISSAYALSERANCNSLYVDRLVPTTRTGVPAITVYLRVKSDVLRLGGVKEVSFAGGEVAYENGHQVFRANILRGEKFFSDNYWKVTVPVNSQRFGGTSGDFYAEGNWTTQKGNPYQFWIYSTGDQENSALENLLQNLNRAPRGNEEPSYLVFDQKLFSSLERDLGRSAGSQDGPELGVATHNSNYRHYNPFNCYEN